MAAPDLSLPFKVSTYKVSFHDVNSSREGLRDRIQRDSETDVWCLQGVNLSKQLKQLPSNYEMYYPAGMAFAHNSARVRLIEKDAVNFAMPLLFAAEERPCIADSFPVSNFHMRKMKIFVGFAAYEMLPQRAMPTSASAAGSTTRLVATHRILVVNADLERYRTWGDAFMCNLLRLLFRFIWDDNKCYTKRWLCSHVCLAGSFFFPPGSVPYKLLTSHSGGQVETVAARVVVAPFAQVAFDDAASDAATGDVGSATTQACVVAAEVGDATRCRQLLAVQLRRADEVDGPPVAVTQLRLSVLDTRSGDYEAERTLLPTAEGWWTLPDPLNTSAADVIVGRLLWCRPAVDAAEAPLSVSLRVRSFGIFTPQRQDAEGLPVGVALLRSGTAGTVSDDDAVALAAAVLCRLPSSPRWAERLDGPRRALGEPVITALYRDGADTLPDCYDYVFVTSFTGARVVAASRLTVADFAGEAATPHLPVSCTVAIPCVER